MFANTFTLALAALAFCGTSTAHMMITSPVPYGQSTLNTSPLSGDGDYPCKQTGRESTVYNITAPNPMTVGEKQTLSFYGSASHGGGTCQLAVSLDKKPTADSTFKIIQVYTGGCPTAGDGNDGSNNFTYSIPKGFPNGDATFAWVWNNKIGNREIYMNCAPITVSGGSDTKDYYDTLPNLYLVNDPVDPTCTVPDSQNVIIPTPGSFVTTIESTSLVSASGSGCPAAAAAQTSGVAGGASGYGGSSASASAPASSSAQPTSAAGYGGTGASSASAPAYSSSAAPPAYSAASSASAQASATSAFPSTNPAPGEGVYGPATTAASVAAPAGTGSSSSGILCDASHAGQYGQMVNGETVWRAVAAGTTCSEVQQYRKRSAMRHAHVRRHVQNAAIRHGA